MRKLVLIAFLATFGFSQIITVVDKGVVRKIYIKDNKSFLARGMQQNNFSQIIVAFKDASKIKEFAKKYKLSLKKRLKTGYFIFINNSNLSDSELILKIIKEQKDIIKTIRPNYGFGNIAY